MAGIMSAIFYMTHPASQSVFQPLEKQDEKIAIFSVKKKINYSDKEIK